MAAYELTVLLDGQTKKILTDGTKTILEALRDAGEAALESPCGGRGTCRKCGAAVTGHLVSVDDGSILNAQGQEVLTCRYRPAGDLLIVPRAQEKMTILSSGDELRLAPDQKGGLGAAFDIGTTTVAAFLYDLSDGHPLARSGERNDQRGFGADVISRITACSEGKLPDLAAAIRGQLRRLLLSMCEKCGRDPREVRTVSVAGNTVMEHLFDALSPVSIGVAPYTPLSLFGAEVRGGETFDAMNFGGLETLYLCPCIAGYVGGDISAGLWASDGDAAEGLRLYIDIGTNGEMALGNRERYWSCATAAGPAFEGAGISCGMPGTDGAIDHVTLRDGERRIHTIGDGEAKGVCGSGLLDAVRCLLELEIVTESGRMLGQDQVPEAFRERVVREENGHYAFLLTENVRITAEDVREVQLASAAIRAGAETLLELSGKDASDITELLIAGGFGNYMSPESARFIGLLPEVPLDKIRFVGNAAGKGAVLALTKGGREALGGFSKKMDYLELSGSQEFSDNYIEFMAFCQ